jgi:hypothetical protein
MAARKHNQFAPTFEALEGRELASANPVVAPNNTLDQAPVLESHTVVRVANAAAPQALAASAPQATGRADPLSGDHRTYVSLRDLRKGDILLNTTNHILSDAIKDATKSNYNHAAIYIGGGKVVEATGEGVHVTHLSNYLDKTKPFLGDNDIVRVMVLRNPNLSVEQQEGIANFALRKANEHAKYNTLGVIGAALQIKPLNYMNYERNNYFCSQLVAASYASAGACLDTSLDLTPGQLADMVNRGNFPQNFSPRLSSLGALYDAGFHRSVREGRDVVNLDLTDRGQQLLVDIISKRLNQRGDIYSVRVDRLTLDSTNLIRADLTVHARGFGDFKVTYSSDGSNINIKVTSPSKSQEVENMRSIIEDRVASGMPSVRTKLSYQYADRLAPRAVAPMSTGPVGDATDGDFAVNAGFHEPIMVG